MRAHEKAEVAYEHGSAELVAWPAPDQSHGVSVVLDVRVFDCHLADHIASVDGDKADADGEDHACDQVGEEVERCCDGRSVLNFLEAVADGQWVLVNVRAA